MITAAETAGASCTAMRPAPPAPGLVRKYDVAAPRYTSYPPATRFAPETEPGAIAREIAAALAADNADPARPLSLYFHLPFCETRCWYCGCHTVITGRRAEADEYLASLERELELTAAQIDPRRPVTQVHLGGGTPTFFPPATLRALGRAIDARFQRAADCEFGVEIDPRRVTPEHIEALREIGANRASLGVQDTDRRVQLAIHRFQPHRQNLDTVRWLRAAGFRSINVDLIYGLPLQTPESVARTIDDVLELQPDRLSVFSYAHVPWLKPSQRIFEDRGQLPTAEEKLTLWLLVREKLLAAGYVDIGLDHFARPDDELAVALAAGTLHRNFQGYSTRAGASLLGFGISSIAQTPDTYRQNFKSLPEWRGALAAGRLPVERTFRLTAEDQLRRAAIMAIMCRRRLDLAALGREFALDARAHFAGELARLEPLVADGLVRVEGDVVEVTPAGVPFLRVIAMQFDAYLARDGAAPRHARSV